MAIRVIKMDMRRLTEYVKMLGPKFKAAMQKGLTKGAFRCLPIVRKYVRNAPPANPEGKGGKGGAFNTGNYLRSWKATAIPGGSSVFNVAPYAGIIEEGRRPRAKAPPVAAIIPWVMRRLMSKTRGFKNKLDAAKSVAFAVARAIGLRRLVGRKVLERAIPEMTAAVTKEVDAALIGAVSP